jgi:hypothetical protein
MTSRADAVKAGRCCAVASYSAVARPRLDGGEHDVMLGWSGPSQKKSAAPCFLMVAMGLAFVRETGYSTGGGCTLRTVHDYVAQPDAGCNKPGFAQTDRDPVVCVSWQDAKAYIAWLNGKLLGRVPTEEDSITVCRRGGVGIRGTRRDADGSLVG